MKYINTREEMQFAMDSLFEREITFYCNLKKCLCLVRSYYLQTWHRISCTTNTLHSPAYFYLRSIKTAPIRDIPFWKKKKHLHSPTNSNQLQQLNLCCFFFFIIGFFFLELKKKLLLILILLWVLNILKSV